MSRLDLIARLAAQALDRTLLHERERGQEAVTAANKDTASSARDRLTRREIAVLRLLAVGYTNREISNLLGVSLRTVESTRSQLRQILGLRTRAQLVRYAYDTRSVDPNR